MNSTIRSLSAILIFAAAAPAVHAATLITNLGSPVAGFQSGNLGQAFTVGSNPVTITGATLNLRDLAPGVGTITLTIRDYSETTIFGTFTNPATFTTSHLDNTFTIGTPVNLQANTLYKLQLNVSGGANVRWSDPGGSGAYTENGVSDAFMYFPGSGAAGERPARDLIYALEGTIGAAVPEPSAAMLGGLALLGLMRRRR